jgi:site-specific DNA recombinase
MRYAPYYRVSHQDEERGISIDLQRDHCEAHVARHQGILVPAYIDEGKSAFSEDLSKRPAFVRLLADSKARRFDAVVVYMYDRFGRRMRVALTAMHELEQRGVKVESATESNDWLSTGVSLLMAENYSRMLSKRMTDVRLHETRAGRWVGPVPVGYDRVEGFLVPNDKIAAVKRAGELYRTGGIGAGAIARTLNQEGYTNNNGGAFKTTQVEEMLKCVAYAGFVQSGDVIKRGKHEAVWSESEWARIQEVAEQRSFRRATITPTAPLLAGLMVCGGCGAPMWYQPNGRFRYYRCSACINRVAGPIAGLRCTSTYARADAMESRITAWVGALSSMSLMDDVKALLTLPVDKPPQVDVEGMLKRLARAYADGAYTDAEYEQRRRALLAKVEPVKADPQEEDAGILELVRDLPALFRETSPEHRQAILRELVSEVYGRKDALLAIRPTRLAETLFRAADARSDWQERANAVLMECTAGGPGGYPAANLSTLPPIRTFDDLLVKAGFGNVDGSAHS